MTVPLQVPFSIRPNGNGPHDLVPLLPIALTRGNTSIDVVGLVDTGSCFSILPFDVGSAFGVAWNQCAYSITLSGAFRPTPAKLIDLDTTVGAFNPIRLAFAWAQTNDFPIILGQTNFLFEFDVCIFRSKSEFQVQPRTP